MDTFYDQFSYSHLNQRHDLTNDVYFIIYIIYIQVNNRFYSE